MKKKYVAGLVLFGGLFLTGLSACGGSKDDGASKVDVENIKPYGKFDEEQTFTVGRQKTLNNGSLLEGDTVESNSWTRYLKEHSNIAPKLAWEAADYKQKLSLSLSTGDIPDVLSVDQEYFNQLIENDLIMDLTDLYDKGISDYIKEITNTYEQNIIEIAKANSDGKLYGIPTGYPYYENNFVWIRKDWLDKVGLPVPETLDELGAAAKAFVEKDVSGTGETIGMTFRNDLSDTNVVVNQFNSYPGSYMDVDGKVQYSSTQPETKEALTYLSEWYKEGIIDQDFATRKTEERQSLLTDRCGINFGAFYSTDFINSYKQGDQKPEWIALTPVKEKGDKYQTLRAQPINQYIVISKKCKNPEAVIRAINDTVDFNHGAGDAKAFIANEAKEHGQKFLNILWNDPMIQINISNAKKNLEEIDAVDKALETGNTDELNSHLIKAYNQIKDFKDGKDVDPTQYLYKEVGLPIIARNNNIDFNDAAFYGVTPGMKKYNANLKKLEQETFVKIVMGEKSVDSFDDFVSQYNKQGGDTIIKEVRENVEKGIVQ